jgi:hypothetical protein
MTERKLIFVCSPVQGATKDERKIIFDIANDVRLRVGIFTINPLVTSTLEFQNPDKVEFKKVENFYKQEIDRCTHFIIPDLYELDAILSDDDHPLDVYKQVYYCLTHNKEFFNYKKFL